MGGVGVVRGSREGHVSYSGTGPGQAPAGKFFFYMTPCQNLLHKHVYWAFLLHDPGHVKDFSALA